MKEEHPHIPVMLEDVLKYLKPKSGGLYLDLTLGRGGHSEAILNASSPDGQLIAFDRDQSSFDYVKERLSKDLSRIEFHHAVFSKVKEILGDKKVDGVLADIGVSSPQLDEAERGFAFRKEGPIDMRMDPSQGETALELMERVSEEELANLIYELGEERKSRRIAAAIKKALKEGIIKTTFDLRDVIHQNVGARQGRIDSATRTFQALRIAVNDELGELKALLDSLASILKDDGVAVIISFHSLEDRIVKWSFRKNPELKIITKRPIQASKDEIRINKRSRTAKLRVAKRIVRGDQ